MTRLDLGLQRLETFGKAPVLPTELAILMVTVASRQATSPTARTQARLDRARPRGAAKQLGNGAFHDAAAAALTSEQGV